jgi:23S rRNA (uracil1939-C5)-methyltransferase
VTERGAAEGPGIGELVEATIEKAVYRGRGLARTSGRVLFVPRAHPGDRVRAQLVAVHAGWAEGRLVEVLEASPDRRPSPCAFYPECGGCAYQDLRPEAQAGIKERVLLESLRRGGAPFGGPIRVHTSPERGWRVRTSLHFSETPGGLVLGFRREGSHRVVDVLSCLQLSDRMNAAARSLCDAVAARPGLPRSVRGLTLVEPPGGGSLSAMLDTRLRPAEVPALAAIGATVPGLTGFGARAGGRLHWLSGSPFSEAEIGGVRLRFHVESFFQANRFLLEPLVQTVLDLARGQGRVVDLYSGVGLFALPLAAAGREVVAVEGAPTAVEDARANARRNGLRLRVTPGDVEGVLASLAPSGDETVVLDPPRGGAGPGVVDLVAARAPETVVYVSCDPPTLGRDLARFATHRYHPDAVHLFDLFPDTFHLETVVRLRRDDKAPVTLVKPS